MRPFAPPPMECSNVLANDLEFQQFVWQRCPSLVENTVNHACSTLVIRGLDGAFFSKTQEPDVGSSPVLQSSLEILVNSFSSSWIRSAYLVAASTSC